MMFQLLAWLTSPRLVGIMTVEAVMDSEIHSTRGVNKIIKYNDKLIFFSLYVLYFYYNMIYTIKKIIPQYMYHKKYIYLTS